MASLPGQEYALCPIYCRDSYGGVDFDGNEIRKAWAADAMQSYVTHAGECIQTVIEVVKILTCIQGGTHL